MRIDSAIDVRAHVNQVPHLFKFRRADTFSESDPYLAAFWDGQPLGESPVIYNCADPKWDECVFHFPVLDVAKSQGKKGTDGRGALRRSVTAPKSSQALAQSLSLKTLLIEVRDYDRIGEHKTLGEIELNGEAIAQLVKRSDLSTKKAEPKSIKGSLSSIVVARAKYSLDIAAASNWLLSILSCGFYRMSSAESSTVFWDKVITSIQCT